MLTHTHTHTHTHIKREHSGEVLWRSMIFSTVLLIHILRTKNRLNEILAKNTGKPLEIIERDTDRDNFLTATEACEYGLVDKVIEKR